MQPDAYGVWDTQENKWWTRNNKLVWSGRAAAANAWNVAKGRSSYSVSKGLTLFSGQDRFVTKAVRFEALD